MRIDVEVLRWLYNSDLSFREKSLFTAIACLRPKSLTKLAYVTGFGRGRAADVCKALARKDWIRLVPEGTGLRPVPWIPWHYQRKQVERLLAEYDMAPLKGEFLLRRLLLFLVDRDVHLYNVRPRYLVNPVTGKRLEYDCLIDKDAWEHNGAQHYSITEKFGSAEELDGTMARDQAKKALSVENGITLTTIAGGDLSVEGIRRTMPPDVLTHHVDLTGPYALTLERLCSAYRRRRERAQAAKAQQIPAEGGGTEATVSANDAAGGARNDAASEMVGRAADETVRAADETTRAADETAVEEPIEETAGMESSQSARTRP